MPEPTRARRIAGRIFGVIIRILGLVVVALFGWTAAQADWEPNIVTPAVAYVWLVTTAILAARARGFAWQHVMPFISMPLGPFAMLRLSLRQWPRDVATAALIASAFAAGSKSLGAVLFACIAIIAAASVALLLALVRRTGLLQVIWIGLGAIAWIRGKDATLDTLHTLGWQLAPLTAALLFIAIACIASAIVYKLLPHWYTLDAILGINTWVRPSLSQIGDLVDPDDRLSRRLRAAWSARTYAMLMLVTRNATPEAVAPVVEGMAKGLAITLGLAWLVKVVWHMDAGFVIPGFVLAVQMFAMLTHAPHGTLRSNWSHPLVEMLPIDVPGYGRRMLLVDVAGGTIVLLLATIAMLLTPFARYWFVPLASIPLLLVVSLISILVQASIYRIDPRRTAWSRFARNITGVGAALVLVVAAIGSIFVAAIVGMKTGIVLGVLLAVGALVFAWLATWSAHRRHRFDAEYLPAHQASARW